MKIPYYDDLDLDPDPARRVGWRHRIEQAYRFELAVEVIGATSGPVLDIGCGVGALADYMAASGLARPWIGIEPHAPFAAEAASHGTVLAARFEDVDPVDVAAGCALAIGTIAGDVNARQTLPELLRFATAAAPALCVVLLDADALRLRPALRLDHAGAAVSRDALHAVAGRFVPEHEVLQISRTDLALVVRVGEGVRTNLERFDATVEGPWGRDEPADRKAWLAAEVGLTDRAFAWLNRAGPTPLAELVRERLGVSDQTG